MTKHRPPVSTHYDEELKNGSNLRAELKQKKSTPGLEDPRIPAWQDILAARRRWLMVKGRWSKERSAENYPQPPANTLKTATPSEMQSVLYKYVRKEAFTTDGMGYGEVVEDVMKWYGKDGEKRECIRISQRTSSGRQVLDPSTPEQAPGHASKK